MLASYPVHRIYVQPDPERMKKKLKLERLSCGQAGTPLLSTRSICVESSHVAAQSHLDPHGAEPALAAGC